jgi:hypothetical protein
LSPCSPELHFVLTSLSLRHTQPALSCNIG